MGSNNRGRKLVFIGLTFNEPRSRFQMGTSRELQSVSTLKGYSEY